MALSVALALPSSKPSSSAFARRLPSKPTKPLSAFETPRSVLSTDVGTSGIKAGLYALACGLALCRPAFSTHSTSFSAACRTQNSHAWYSSIITAVRSLAAPSVVLVAFLAVTVVMQKLSLFATPGGGVVLGDGTAYLYSSRARRRQRPPSTSALVSACVPKAIIAKILRLQECGLRPDDGVLTLGSADVVVFPLCKTRVADGTNLSTTGLRGAFERLEKAGMDA